MYAISASHLLKSLKLEVQHCIDLSDPSLCKYMKFAVAPVHTSSLPYQFNIVKGGEFPANSRYGSIERSKFCLLGIVGEEENGAGQGNGELEQNNEGQDRSNGEEGGGDSGDGDSGDEGGKGGRKKKEVQGQQGEEGGGAGPHSGGEGGGIELNQQQQESLQQEGADEQMEQYQDGEDEEDEVKSKAEGEKVQHKGKCCEYLDSA